MSASTQYKILLTKVASSAGMKEISQVYDFCLSKQANLMDGLLWAGIGAVPAYVAGQSMARDEEKKKHKNYALAGAAAGFLAPKLLSALVDPASAFPSASGFDASDIKNLQLESLD